MPDITNQDPNVDPNANLDPNKTDPENTQPNKPNGSGGTTDLDNLVQERLDAALKDIKTKLDKAYSARDEALTKAAAYEREKKEAELKRLQEEGKHKEAYDLQLAELDAANKALEKRNVELTRDIEVRNALGTHPFRNDNASEMAYREIVGQLVQDDKGQWVHRSGTPIRDFVKSFAESDDNAFLFKPKVSSGSGSSGSKPNTSSETPSSLFKMSQAEVLKLAREGKLPKPR